jgi:hypothetical protein
MAMAEGVETKEWGEIEDRRAILQGFEPDVGSTCEAHLVGQEDLRDHVLVVCVGILNVRFGFL